MRENESVQETGSERPNEALPRDPARQDPAQRDPVQRAKRTAKVLGWVTALVLLAPLPFVFAGDAAAYLGFAVLAATWFFLLPFLLIGLFICAMIVAVKIAADPSRSALNRRVRAAIWGSSSVAVAGGAIALGGATLPVLGFLGMLSILMQISFWATLAGARRGARWPRVGLVVSLAVTILLLAQSVVAQQYELNARDLYSTQRMTESKLRDVQVHAAAECLSVPGHEVALNELAASLAHTSAPVLPEPALAQLRQQVENSRAALDTLDMTSCEQAADEMRRAIAASISQMPELGADDVAQGSRGFAEHLSGLAGWDSSTEVVKEPTSFWVMPWALGDIAHKKELAGDRLGEARSKSEASEEHFEEFWTRVSIDTLEAAELSPASAENVIAAAPTASETEADNLRALAQAAKRSGVAGLVAYVDAANEMLGR